MSGGDLEDCDFRASRRPSRGPDFPNHGGPTMNHASPWTYRIALTILAAALYWGVAQSWWIPRSLG